MTEEEEPKTGEPTMTEVDLGLGVSQELCSSFASLSLFANPFRPSIAFKGAMEEVRYVLLGSRPRPGLQGHGNKTLQFF